MKKYLLALCLFLTACKKPSPVVETPLTPTAGQLASHYIEISLGFGHAVCTAEAIGPHALLTAEHCDPDVVGRTMMIDDSTHLYNIVGSAADDRDHLILLIDGPAFDNYIEVKTRPSKIGEHVTIFGVGGREYPPIKKEGVRIAQWERPDYSDVDKRQGEEIYTIHAIPGDSGSSIFADNGDVVGIVTYKMKPIVLFHFGDKDLEIHYGSAGFELAFTAQDYKTAREFKGTHGTINRKNWRYYRMGEASKL